jgi:hypothetical protein
LTGRAAASSHTRGGAADKERERTAGLRGAIEALDPNATVAGRIGRIDTLRDDTPETATTGSLAHRLVVDVMLAVDEARRRMAEERRQPLLRYTYRLGVGKW